MKYRFERIAIVNRGAAAIRLIRAVRELNCEQHLNLSTVALFTEPDRQAMFVREADDAVCIGPAALVDQRDGQYRSSYLYLGQDYRLKVSRLGPQHYRVTAGGQRIEVRVEQLGPFERRITCYGRRYRAFSVIDGLNYYVGLLGPPTKFTTLRSQRGLS